MLVGAVLLGLLALAVTVWLCGRALALAHGRVHPLYLLVPAGVYAMVLAPVWVLAGGLSAWGADPREGSLPLYGTLWSDANGMETSLALLAFGGLLLFVVRAVPRGRDGVFLGLLLGALVLARLDLAFVVVGIGSTLVVAALREGAATVRRCTMAGAAVCAAIVAGYLGWNRWYSGMALPVSGQLKTTFPHPTAQNLRTLVHLVPSIGSDHRPLVVIELFRLAGVVIPSLAAVVYLAVRAGGADRQLTLATARGRFRLALVGSCGGVLLLSAYDTLFVPLFDQGSWYWPVSTFLVTLVAVDLADRPSRGRQRTRLAVLVPLVVGAVAANLAVFLVFEHRASYHARYAEFAEVTAPEVRHLYRGRLPRFVEADDGICTYFLGAPSLSATGLAADAEAAAAIRRHQLLALALRRGYDRIDSLVYEAARPGATSGSIALALTFVFPGEDLTPYRFSLEYFDPRTHMVVVRVRRVRPAGAQLVRGGSPLATSTAPNTSRSTVSTASPWASSQPWNPSRAARAR